MFFSIFIALLLGLGSPSNTNNCTTPSNGGVHTMDDGGGGVGGDKGGDTGQTPPPKP